MISSVGPISSVSYRLDIKYRSKSGSILRKTKFMTFTKLLKRLYAVSIDYVI